MKRLLFLLTTLPTLLCGTEFAPWFAEVYEFDGYLSANVYAFDNVQGRHQLFHQPAVDQFYTAGVIFPFIYPIGFDNLWCVEVEATLADTRHQRGRLDNMRITGRYQWLDDVIDDDVSLVTGVTLTQAFTSSLRDISSCHHGRAEIEAHVSVGREVSVGPNWDSRCWGLLALGAADQGAFWARSRLTWEKNFCEAHFLGVFVDGLWGFGGKQIHSLHHFHGYGLIAHESIDVGVKYDVLTAIDAVVGLSYAYRLYARNFPLESHRVTLRVDYPFGL